MSNITKVRDMANRMADEIRLHDEFKHSIPDWAGLAWIVSPYYNSRAYKVFEVMPFEWLHKAKRLVAALQIAYEWRRDQKKIERIEKVIAKGNA